MVENEPVPADHEHGAEPASPDASNLAADDGADRGAEKQVPVSEARRYRKRAQAAETAAAELRAELDARSAMVQEQQQLIADLQLRQEVDERLVEAGAIDLETARLLTELGLKEMDEPDVEQAVDELSRRKPFLFHRRLTGSGALSPKDGGLPAANDQLEHAAAEARETGRRQDLLTYLRLRRRR